MCFPVTDVNNQPKLQFPTPFPQTFASFHKISTWQHTKKWNIHITLRQRTKPGGIFGIYSAVFSSPGLFLFIFHWHIKFFFFCQNVVQVLAIEELLTICSLEVRRWRWPASIVNFGQSFVKEQKQPSQIEMCRCWPLHVFHIFFSSILGFSATFGLSSSFWSPLIVLVSISRSLSLGWH